MALLVVGSSALALRPVRAADRLTPSRELSFEARVAARRAIEEVYWRHRIWPAENKSPKPPLAATVPEAALRNLVEDELRMSNTLAIWWGSHVSGRELQAEIDRMARDTRDPALLRELFAALRQDPLLVAETLARPMFVDRSIRNRYAFDDRFHGAVRRRAQQALQGVRGVADLKAAGDEYVEQTYRQGSSGRRAVVAGDGRSVIDLDGREWAAWREDLAARFNTTVESIPVLQVSTLKEEAERFSVTAVLAEGSGETRVATVVWPKRTFDDWWQEVRASTSTNLDESGDAYTLTEPASEPCLDDSWETRFFAPAATSGHTAVWTGTEMIVWGGYTGFQTTSEGGRYNPATDSWRPTSTGLNVPAGRRLHSAVWTGSEMIVWGGESIYGPGETENVGGRYNPLTDTWMATSTDGQPPVPRFLHTAIWTGTEMIVWGGGAGATVLGSGGRYDPASNSWAALPEGPSAPSPRTLHTAVWTGTEMIIWGGRPGGSNTALNTGGRYQPASNTWTPTPIGPTDPGPRSGHTAVWTGTEMIVWGGGVTDPFSLRGLRYSPAAGTWTRTAPALATTDLERGHAAIWTGSEMIVWGGDGLVVSRGARYAPGTDSWTSMAPVPNWPGGLRSGFSAVWTGAEMIVWGGTFNGVNGSSYTSTGERYDPTTDSWRPVAAGPEVPAVRFLTSAVWTGVEMIVWGGFNLISLNTGGLYRPATDTWQATATGDGVPWGRASHSAIWTGTEMIVWGGGRPPYAGDNSGGRYSPVTNIWTPTSAGGAPQGRQDHSALWTGQEMVIWGGYATLPTAQTFNSGGRYDPSTDTWTATSLGENVPAARSGHSAVWTGSEMIVWGGSEPGVGRVNTGGRYDPSLDSWLPTPVGEGVPSPRFGHAATWTGSEMLVLGGSTSDDSVYAGDRYDPVAGTWVATSPTELTRRFGEAAWTGSEMIVWGGGSAEKPGARYHPGTDSWSVMSTGRNLPPPHSGYQSVWTGSLMLMWGGVPLSPTLGVYCARDCHAPGDEDGDTVGDVCDRCPAVPDPDQGDFDDDGLGDACESGAALADADGSARVDGFDLARLARAFGKCDGAGGYDTTVDLDRSSCVDGADLAILADFFGASVGAQQ